MQSTSTNICERIGHSREFSEFQCGKVMPYVQKVQSGNFGATN